MRSYYFLLIILLASINVVCFALTFEEQRIKDDYCGKHRRWCQRVKKCVTPCKGCRAPYIIGNKYYCTKLNYCKVGEWCRGNSCHGKKYGKNYKYQPTDLDPCLNHN